MVERNDKGKEARRYFIQVEREHQKLSKALLATDPLVLKKLADLLENNRNAFATIESQKPKVELAEKVLGSDRCVNFAAFANLLYEKESLNIGRNKLSKWLKENKYIQKNRSPYQQYLDAGYFEVTIKDIYPVTLITSKGILKLTEKIIKSGSFSVES